jgi:hypothetical protein
MDVLLPIQNLQKSGSASVGGAPHQERPQQRAFRQGDANYLGGEVLLFWFFCVNLFG